MELASVAPCLRSALRQTDDPVMPIPRQLSNDRSTRDPPSPTDEARVLRVTLSTLLPWRLRGLPASEAPCMRATSVVPCHFEAPSYNRWLPASPMPPLRTLF